MCQCVSNMGFVSWALKFTKLIISRKTFFKAKEGATNSVHQARSQEHQQLHRQSPRFPRRPVACTWLRRELGSGGGRAWAQTLIGLGDSTSVRPVSLQINAEVKDNQGLFRKAETQMVFWLEGKGEKNQKRRGAFDKGKGNNYIYSRKAFLYVQISQHTDVNSKEWVFVSFLSPVVLIPAFKVILVNSCFLT